MNHFEATSNLAFFLLERTKSVLGRWRGRMPAAEQSQLFGRFLGKGVLTIDGSREEVVHTRKVCFGLDWDDSIHHWRDLGTPQQAIHPNHMEQLCELRPHPSKT